MRASVSVVVFLAIGLLLKNQPLNAQSASNQLCGAAGQGAGCIGGFSSHSTAMPAAGNFAAGYNPYLLGMPWNMPFLWMDTDKTPQRNPARRTDAEKERQRKKKLKLITLYADFRDPAPAKLSPPKNQSMVEQNAISDLAIDLTMQLFPKSTGDPILDQQAEMKRCLHSGSCTSRFSDPLARQAFMQSGNTCSIAVQVEILKREGRPFSLTYKDGHKEAIDPAKMTSQQLEDKLFDYSKDKNYFQNGRYDAGGGTRGSLTVQILNDAGFQVVKKYDLDFSDISRALKQGHYIKIGVSPGDLWRNPDPNFLHRSHAVLITGVVEKDGGVQGLYINDTGTANNKERAGFLVPAEYLKRAWRNNDNRNLYEAIPPAH